MIEHYQRVFGTPSRRAKFAIRRLPVTVLVWDPDRTSQGVYLYATVGASKRPLGDPGVGHRFELFAGTLPNEPGVAAVLSLAAAYPSLFGEDLGHGHSIPYEQPLWVGTDMHLVLVARPVEEIIPLLELPDGSHVEFLQAVPAHDSEIAFKATHGLDELRRAWREAEVPFWDPRRPGPHLPDRGV